jgi:CRISPR/Cas system-associated exonuclease Cas4 (RecB family)
MSTEAGQPPAAGLSPSQRRTLEALRRSGEPLVFDGGFVDELVAEVTDALDQFADRLDGAELVVSKHRLASVLDCETHHLARSDFEWTAANAKGTVAHRAIQLLLSWRGEPTPIDLVDEAMARLIEEERGIGSWIGGLGDADVADLRGQSAVRVTQFLEHFPPLSTRWHPVTEASVRWPVQGPVMLFGKVDLAFGPPSGAESRKVIIDLKTGRPSPRHRQDLGYYALLETLTRRVPPRKVATFYLDAGEPQAEDVSERLLRSALRRTLDGIHALVELEVEGRDPTVRPGHTCRWCPLASECEPGQRWLESADGE